MLMLANVVGVSAVVSLLATFSTPLVQILWEVYFRLYSRESKFLKRLTR